LENEDGADIPRLIDDGSWQYTFTVFTPTYNRAHTLHRLHDSLVVQTDRDFEWLIVDDGSTDDTEALVRSWQRDSQFPIRYLRQPHAGKHVAFNFGVREAQGELFFTVDSDDALVARALERYRHHWESIPESRRGQFSAVTALAVDEHGELIGTRFPQDPTDASALEIRFRYKVKGDKAGFQRTALLRAYHAPEIPGYTGLVPESLVWNAIARRYKERYVNEILEIKWLGDPGDRLSTPAADPARIAPGTLLGYEQLLGEDIRWARYAPIEFLVEAARYSRMAFHGGRSVRAQWRAVHSDTGRILWLATLPIGWTVYALERRGWRPGRRWRQPSRRPPVHGQDVATDSDSGTDLG
jgi:glycosyltransferase involved in cell wall biosynthesis